MRPHRFIPSIGNLLILAGVLLLVPPVTHWWVAARAQSGAAQALDRGPVAKTMASGPSRAPVREGEALGRLKVARLGIDVVVFEGTSEETLRKGPGHLRGTVWPGDGASGNCVISAHRDTFFRRLEGARAGDVVKVHGTSGIVSYRLENRRIVRPEEVDALGPFTDDRLTLVTCYPFHFIGPAPYRLVWQAHRVEAGVDTAALR